MNIKEIINNQKTFFLNDNTKNINQRISILKQLKKEIIAHQNEIYEAFKLDFNKCPFDIISNELILVLDEINYMLKNIKKAFKWKKKTSNIFNVPAKFYQVREAYGVVLIISPWNYPLQLSLLPLIGAIACGNTVILKPSEISKNVSNVLEKILSSFDKQLICVIQGDANITQEILKEKFDYIFFTGSEKVGKIIMEKASYNLTPVTLELGGKSPCIISKNVNLKMAAKRIAWGKYLNAGQTCVAPDYILISNDIKKQFIDELINEIKNFYYENDNISPLYPNIINEKHVDRLKNLIDYNKVVFGGKINGCLIEPTIIDNVTFDDIIMQDEIFGPLLPIISYDNILDVIKILKTKEKPLALYYFGNDKKEYINIINSLSFGGGCINDTIMHITNLNLPFGGVGNSGMGSYHGLNSINTFSHLKTILIKGKIELNLKYPPHSEKKTKFVKKFFKIK